jgi:uncharacterized protein (DUF58 family)
VLVVVAATLSLVGFAYQVEEFVLVAVGAAAIIPFGLVLAYAGARRLRRNLRVDVSRPDRRVVVGHQAEISVAIANVGAGAVSGVALGVGSKWHVSFPGLPGGRGRQGRNAGVPETVSARSWWARSKSVMHSGSLTPLPDIGPGGRWSTTVEVPTAARGLLTLDPLDVWCCDPLGLMAVHATTGRPVHVVVCPDPDGPLDDWASPPGMDDARGQTRSGTAVSRVEGDELNGLRSYVPGDRLTRLHWPAVARTGDLMVRHFVEIDVRRTDVMIDVRPGYVETSVREAAVRGAAALDLGAPVVIRTTAGEELAVDAGAGASASFLQALAVIGPAYKR